MRVRDRRSALPGGAALAVVALLLASAPPAAAQTPQLITPYPSVFVEAGKSVTFNIEVRLPSPQRVDLAVTETPPGWQATLRGGGFQIGGVFGRPDDPPQVQLEVRVPADAAKGDYRVVVRGSAGAASSTLDFRLTVAEVVAGAVTLTAESPTLRDRSSATFRFNLTLTNNTPEATTFNLSTEGPEGWDIQARPTGQSQAATLRVEGGSSGTIEVEADPPENVAAETYQIKVRAAGAGQNAEATLSAEVVGSPQFTLTTPGNRLNAKAVAGKTSDMSLVVGNEGNVALRGLKMSASPPTGWRVTFSPTDVPEVPPNSTTRVRARLTPSGDAVAGDYVLTLTASGEGASENVEIRVTVETSRLWGLVGLAVIGAAAYGLLWVFRKYGRR